MNGEYRSVISHGLPIIDDDCIEALTNSECHFVTMKKEIIMWNQQEKDINSFMT